MIVTARIEDPRGSTCRHVNDEANGTWRRFPHPHVRSPWPAAYGELPGTRNAADGDPLDVIVLSERPLTTGDEVPVRLVGLLERPDGDHKLLAVDLADRRLARAVSLEQLPPEDLAPIEAWFREWSTFAGWSGGAAACRLIASCQ